MPSKRIALLGVLAAIACAVTASTASASPSLMKGIYDDANLLTGDPDQNYAILGDLRTKVVRLHTSRMPCQPAPRERLVDRAVRMG